MEQRRSGDTVLTSVLLDSVASQANRMEEALLAAWRAGDLDFPVVGVDFSDQDELGDLGPLGIASGSNPFGRGLHEVWFLPGLSARPR